MNVMTAAEIRRAFLGYFAENGHEIVASSPLVPGNDPTLLFTNAGMVQFKEVFLGDDPRAYNRATSSQCCLRAGGKHNDLENVGYTARHHTFFEMLGNFSFGDYFKKEAIQFAWIFITEYLQLPKERLWVTVYQDDAEAEAIWVNEIGFNPKRISRCGDKDNFWSMGDTGPCGPCSEIFYDHGEEIAGGPPGTPEEDGDRFIEIWNLVFMQYDRNAAGELVPLPKPSVDTGMGLERISAIMQGVHNNYDIDLFQHLIKTAAQLLNVADLQHPSLKVIADHIRACSFLIAEGVLPGNEGRQYVLRRIIRRAVRHGNKLGASQAFFYKLVPALITVMGDAYPVLAERQAIIEQVLQGEEEQFARTVAQGLQHLQYAMSALSGTVLPGDVVFKLYDTYGFPDDLTADVAREHDLTLDYAGFLQLKNKQKADSQAASNFTAVATKHLAVSSCSQFDGYDGLAAKTTISELVKGENVVSQLISGDPGILVLAATPFYPEGGGQVGDQGMITADGVTFRVDYTSKQQQAILHHGVVLEGELTVGQTIVATVNTDQRLATMANHSATHLLHAALREALGSHVTQKGSLVESARLRFDFSHFQALTAEELLTIENRVNSEIRANHVVQTELMSPQAAQEAGAMALFGEKYGEKVRVLTMGCFSKELCGGTHVARTGDIGLFKITSESGTAAGIRRIEAVTAAVALNFVQDYSHIISQLSYLLKAKPEILLSKVEQSQAKLRQAEKAIQKLQAQLLSGADSSAIDDNLKCIKNANVLAAKVPAADMPALRETLDRLKNQHQPAIIILASVVEDKVNLVVGVSKPLTTQIAAGSIIKELAVMIGGRGGGRADMAQAGGHQPEAVDAMLAESYNLVDRLLA